MGVFGNVGPCFRSIPADFRYLRSVVEDKGWLRTWKEEDRVITRLAGKIFSFLALHASGAFLLKGAFSLSPLAASGAGVVVITLFLAKKVLTAGVHMALGLYLAKTTAT